MRIPIFLNSYVIWPWTEQYSDPTSSGSTVGGNSYSGAGYTSVTGDSSKKSDHRSVNPAIALTHALLDQLEQIERRLEDPKTGKIFYKYAEKTRFYASFELLACELHTVDLDNSHTLPTNDERMAFGINVFNIMFKYAMMKVGLGQTSSARQAFWSQIKFRIGPHLYSFHEWEHGFLRGNSKAPHGLQVPFSRKDPRLTTICQTPDPRLHFGLTTGTQRCRDIIRFSGSDLRSDLVTASQVFTRDDANVRIGGNADDSDSLYLNQIFWWYRADFDQDGRQGGRSLPGIVRDMLPPGPKKDSLIRLLAKYQENVKVQVLKYDWGDEIIGDTVLAFQPASLKGDRHRLSRMLTSQRA